MWKRTHQVCGSPPEGRNTIHQKTDFHPGWEHSHQDRNDESDGSKQICTHLQWWFTSGGQVEPKSIKKQNIFACEFYFCATVLSLWSEEYRLTEFQSLLCCYMTYMLSMCQTQCNKQTKRGNNKNGKRNKISLHFILLKWSSVTLWCYGTNWSHIHIANEKSPFSFLKHKSTVCTAVRQKAKILPFLVGSWFHK